ncbi:MAG: 50S ribosomal protein L23 [Candidatus Eremiobacteraeota bacterium]|nr:50S ribosomal protein L23 [Candidatus Eremiobacteraeota bacterium]MBV8356064.1 50S ribosomal protein L23 [Candidatus Eremiobacteraeota bacterium]
MTDARDVIIAPLITEKSMTGTARQQYTFEVHPRATKTQIRQAIEEIFGVTVRKVNTVQVGGKHKSFARRRVRTEGRQADWKKAIVTLAEGQKIELGGVNYFEQ